MDVPVLNWTAERSAVEEFLAGGSPVMHVRCNDDAHPSGFVGHVATFASGAGHKVSLFAARASEMASPRAFILALANEFGVDIPQPGVVIKVASDINAEGNVDISGLTLYPMKSVDEECEFIKARSFLLKLCREHPEMMERRLLIFSRLHDLKESKRRRLWSDIWIPVIAPMVSLGLKVIFVFDHGKLNEVPDALPAPANRHITLPDRFGESVTMELVRFVVQADLVQSTDDPTSYSRGLLAGSGTVSQLYAGIGNALMDMCSEC